MDSSLNDRVAIDLPKSVCLVLFELLTRSYEVWREENPDDGSADPMLVEAGELAQRRAIWLLEGALERTLTELFSSNYAELLSEANRILESPSDTSGPGSPGFYLSGNATYRALTFNHCAGLGRA
jgi:hypothetical protein